MNLLIPQNLSTLSKPELETLFQKTGSKRVAAELRRFARPVEVNTPLPPVVAPRPQVHRSVNFRPAARPGLRYER
jgi:hypothetical protein